MKLNWVGVEGVSLLARENIARTLNRTGEMALRCSHMTRETAQKIASLNSLLLDYVSMYYKDKPTQYYIFRINYHLNFQNKLRKEEKKKRQLLSIRNTVIASVTLYLLCLLGLVLFL